jgi:hypothetical protein
MKTIFTILLLVLTTNILAQDYDLNKETDLELIFDRFSVHLSEPTSIDDGILTTRNILRGFDLKPVLDDQTIINLKEISEIQIVNHENKDVKKLRFISGEPKSILFKQMVWSDFESVKSNEIYFRFLKPELLLSLVDRLNQYRFEKTKSNPETNESFDSFIGQFCLNESFQKERIKFPLKLSYRTNFEDRNAPLFDTIIMKQNWKYDDIYYDQVARYQVYDNFEKTLNDTDERVIHYKGIENGRDLAYFFRRINKQWFLVAIENRED